MLLYCEEGKKYMGKNVEKDKALAQVLADIEKQFGKGAIMKLGDQEKVEIEVVPSGSLSLDIALGVGGYPKGRIIETSASDVFTQSPRKRSVHAFVTRSNYNSKLF